MELRRIMELRELENFVDVQGTLEQFFRPSGI